MKKRKQIYLNKITKSGQVNNHECPACEGEGVQLGDYEQGQIDIKVWPCSLCDGLGVAIKDKDYKVITDIYEGTEYVSFDKIIEGDANVKR